MIYRPKLSSEEDPTTPDITILDLDSNLDKQLFQDFIYTLDTQKDKTALRTYFGKEIKTNSEILKNFERTYDWVEYTNGKIVAAKFEGKIIGFSLYNVKSHHATTSTFIDSRIRGYNLGTGLLYTCIATALVDPNVKSVLNYVKSENAGAKRIVEKVLSKIPNINVAYFEYSNSETLLYEVTNKST